MPGLSPVVTAILGLIILLVLIGLLIASRYKVAKPNEAFIITGRKGREVRNPETGLVSTDLSGQKVVMGGGVFVVPFIQRLHTLDLSSRRIMITIRNAVSGQGIKLNVDGVAIVKVGGNEDSIRASAQRFLGQQDEIETFTQETLAGSLRSIVGSLTVEQIIRDRAAFAQRVTDESESSLTGQGLVLDTFQIQDISDDGTYLSDLGRPESAKLGRLAAVAEAEARREAEQAQIAAEQEIAISQRALVLKKAEIQSETDAARATAASAGPLAQADRDQAVLLEQEKVAVAQAALKERQLDTEVRRPADAERYRVETAAEAQRNAAIFQAEAQKAAAIAQAEAEAERQRLTGVGEKSRRVAEADAVRAEGEAKAAAVLAVGQAEAEAMDKRAEAFAHYNEAAVLQMLIEVLPQMAEKVAAPLGNIDKLTVVSTDGASVLPRQVTENVMQTMQMVKDTTGYDLTAVLDRMAGKTNGALQGTATPAE
ncbi:flotillin family protein [Tessaracoccus sp. Y36]